MGWLVRYFLDRFQQFNAKVLGSVVSIIAGGVLVYVFEGSDPIAQYARWFYFMGLLVGVLLYPYISQMKTPKRYVNVPSSTDGISRSSSFHVNPQSASKPRK